MLTKLHAIALLALAEGLPHSRYLVGVSLETVMRCCNGVGARWMERVRLNGGKSTLLDLANTVYQWAAPASLRHDIRYEVGGTSEMRRNDDRCFLEDCLALADRSPWWSFRRYIRRGQARRMYVLLRAFGWLAYHFDNAEDRETEEWISDERAKVAEAELATPPTLELQPEEAEEEAE